MSRTTRLNTIALVAGLTCQIVSAQSTSPDSKAVPVKGRVQISTVTFDRESVAVSGGERCATATVQVAIVGLGTTESAGPTVSVNLVQARTIPPDLAVDIESLDSYSGLPLTSSPGVYRFHVCAAGLPKGFVNGAVSLRGAILLVSPENEWTVPAPNPRAETATLNVTRGADPSVAKPELRLVITPLNLQEATQDGEAVFQFDVVAGTDFAGKVTGLLSITAPRNPDGVELREGFNSGRLYFTLGAGQKLSDANPLRYRIRTTAENSHEGVLTYGVKLVAPGDAFVARDAAQQVTVKVGPPAK